GQSQGSHEQKEQADLLGGNVRILSNQTSCCRVEITVIDFAPHANSTMRTVLVVEDDRPTHALFVALVNRCGFQSKSAFDGPSALRHIREERPDAIILDLLLPSLNGFQILSEIRRFTPALLPQVVVVRAALGSLYGGRT